MTWAEFKSFIQKNLENDQVFSNSIGSKFRRDSQYQLKSILDLATYLKYLQSSLLEYDLTKALS